MGKVLSILILGSALIAGVALYYLQVYHFYEEVLPTGEDDVRLTSLASGEAEPILYSGFEGIDADSSPIRYRACFTTSLSKETLLEAYEPYEDAVPLEAPGWFECFDAGAVGAGLSDGTAQAYLGQRDVIYGIDRVVAIFDDGRGYVWHQINRCGEVVFDGQPVPEDCPTPPER
ncbi:MAG: DUF6446 family protein [Pseudomonadota bacterium]